MTDPVKHSSNKESGEELYFTNARIQKIAISVLKSIAYLHSLDLIHSDLKPENGEACTSCDPLSIPISDMDLFSYSESQTYDYEISLSSTKDNHHVPL